MNDWLAEGKGDKVLRWVGYFLIEGGRWRQMLWMLHLGVECLFFYEKEFVFDVV